MLVLVVEIGEESKDFTMLWCDGPITVTLMCLSISINSTLNPKVKDVYLCRTKLLELIYGVSPHRGMPPHMHKSLIWEPSK